MQLLHIRTFILIFATSKDTLKKKGTIMKTLGYLGAFVCGALTGAALGLLLAPENGTDIGCGRFLQETRYQAEPSRC